MLTRPSLARPQITARRATLEAAAAVAALAAAGGVVAILEQRFGVPNASAVFIVPVVAIATIFGTTPAALTAIAAFVLYDFFFTRPYLTLQVSDPAEWVDLVLFLIIAVVVGRLTALQTERAAEAHARAREAQALFSISRTLATATTVDTTPTVSGFACIGAATAPDAAAQPLASTRTSRLRLDPGRRFRRNSPRPRADGRVKPPC